MAPTSQLLVSATRPWTSASSGSACSAYAPAVCFFIELIFVALTGHVLFASRTITSCCARGCYNEVKPLADVQRVHNAGAFNINGLEVTCAFCRGSHWPSNCDVFTTAVDRKKSAQQAHLCERCLTRAHATEKCVSPKKCGLCLGLHHIALCPVSGHVTTAANGQISEKCAFCSEERTRR